jgi:carboxyl-terminal processing protease
MSASASEILAASLQDYGRAIIVGDSRTHGKGTVQSIVPLKTRRGKRGSLKVTTASFFRINGSSTQVKGVAADIVVSSPLDSLSLGEDAIEYALPWSRIEPLDLERPVGSSLLEDLLLGRFLGGTGNRGERVKDISPMINELKIRSQERRHGNPKFVAREGLLSRYSEREKLDRISLNLDERMKLAMEERRLYELQLAEADIIGDNNNGGRKGRSGDLVLEEALSILADAVAYEARTARAREDD